ncbi:MAG: hypothetical protein ACYTXP_13295 [Nostoc sp.]
MKRNKQCPMPHAPCPMPNVQLPSFSDHENSTFCTCLSFPSPSPLAANCWY